jgi:hypothetical protein
MLTNIRDFTVVIVAFTLLFTSAGVFGNSMQKVTHSVPKALIQNAEAHQ